MTAAAQKRTSSRCVTMTEASGSGPGRAESLVAAESEARTERVRPVSRPCREPRTGDADSSPGAEADRLWRPEEVARFLGLTRKGVYGLAERRILPSIKVGGRLRFDSADIRRWVCAHRRGSFDGTLIDSQARVSLKEGSSS
jgi:excisionase family DNA binding protein